MIVGKCDPGVKPSVFLLLRLLCLVDENVAMHTTCKTRATQQAPESEPAAYPFGRAVSGVTTQHVTVFTMNDVTFL